MEFHFFFLGGGGRGWGLWGFRVWGLGALPPLFMLGLRFRVRLEGTFPPMGGGNGGGGGGVIHGGEIQWRGGVGGLYGESKQWPGGEVTYQLQARVWGCRGFRA